MNKKRVKELLPVLAAWVEGAQVQVRYHENDPWMDRCDMTSEDMLNESWFWRIRPEPKTVPWCMEDVRPGWIRFKSTFTTNSAFWLIIRIDPSCVGICPVGGSMQLISYPELMDKCDYSTDLCNWSGCFKKDEP